MECGMCGILLDDDFMIPGNNGFGVCIDCAKKLLPEIVSAFEHEWCHVIVEKIAEKLRDAKLL